MNNQSLVAFEFSPDIESDLFNPLDQATNDIACVEEGEKDVYLSYINEEKGSFTLFSYLEELASRDPGFKYNISSNTNGELTVFF